MFSGYFPRKSRFFPYITVFFSFETLCVVLNPPDSNYHPRTITRKFRRHLWTLLKISIREIPAGDRNIDPGKYEKIVFKTFELPLEYNLFVWHKLLEIVVMQLVTSSVWYATYTTVSWFRISMSKTCWSGSCNSKKAWIVEKEEKERQKKEL